MDGAAAGRAAGVANFEHVAVEVCCFGDGGVGGVLDEVCGVVGV